MAQPTVFVNQWNKSSENANIGIGNLVGIDLYSKKGVAQLSKVNDSVTYTGGGFTAFPNVPKYIATSGSGTYYMTLTDASNNAHLYTSTDGAGHVWADTGFSVTGKQANGLIFFPCVPASGTLGYYIWFTGNHVYYFQDAGSPSEWFSAGTTPIVLNATEHPSILNPTDGYVYFGNGNLVGKIGYGTGGTFDPATPTTGFYFNTAQLTLPLIYQVTCLSFLMPSYVAIGTTSGQTGGFGYNPQIADLIMWNPINTLPDSYLRLYNRSNQIGVISGTTYGGLIQSGIISIVNRNNVLYALTAGNFCLYETNGVNFSLVTDLSLRSSIRLAGGTEATALPYIAGYAPAMAVIGNKILIGMSTPNTPNYPTSYGLFPCGVWTVAFSDGGGIGEVAFGINGNSVQCEHTISTHTTVAVSNVFQIGCILPIGANSALISWFDNTTYGMDYIDTNNYQNSIGTVIIESEMLEVGSPLNPVTIGSLQFNLVRNLMTGQTVSIYYRTAFDQDFVAVSSPDLTNGTITGDGTKSSYPITSHQIGPTKYVQFQIHMATVTAGTSATIATYTPQLRDFIVGNPSKN